MNRQSLLSLVVLGVCLLLLPLALIFHLGPVPIARAATLFTVDLTADDSDTNPGDGSCDIDNTFTHCTLRAAIEEANALPGADTIEFTGISLMIIQPTSPLPVITDTVTIDGTTGPNSRVQLKGTSAPLGADGFHLQTISSTIRGFEIISFNGDGIKIETGGGNVIEHNWIGITFNNLPGSNGNGIFINNSPNNTIGGTTSAKRNVISNNNNNGIAIVGGSATGNLVQGNYIGTDKAGTADMGNTGAGVNINGAPNNTIGGTGSGTFNVISANKAYGIFIIGSGATGNLIQGNFIGTNAFGNASLGNTFDGILISDAPTNTIGGLLAGKNIISGNKRHGVIISGSGAIGNQVQSNYIGIDLAGTSAISNTFDGIKIEEAPTNTIGSTIAAGANIISGNGEYGISLSGTGATGNVIQGNYIGTDVWSTGSLGNASQGIFVGSSNNTIGGSVGYAPNTIANNGGIGIFVVSGTGNRISRNAIYNNGSLGIDLSPANVTPNDLGDPDTGANNLQNFPTLTSATNDSIRTNVNGMLNSTSSTLFTLEFFNTVSCDASGYGEGAVFLGSKDVTTNGSGNASFAFVSPVPVTLGSSVTATATDPSGNTSEFSQCAQVVQGYPLYLPLIVK